MNGLLVGRFQPFHLGHLEALRFALSQVESLWVGLGSSNRPINADNPFSADERRQMITSSINNLTSRRISIYAVPDTDSHEKWIKKLDDIVPEFGTVFSNDDLTGHLYSGRSVRVVPIPFLQRNDLSGTNIRNLIRTGGKWEDLVPEGTKNFLIKTGAKRRLKDLYK
ncbi:MAG: nicotinamide-nucleotide adenylyltransferase [Nitrosopumilus sp. B06]|nr:MAG: nicotinamide-nucleotide adenylyltransferase [Nitrosopumilus sp. D6]RNJ79511.1 MAG: nicotinamide-nucleotide adenylyltransferase [Nitrosopumilus sp. B06]